MVIVGHFKPSLGFSATACIRLIHPCCLHCCFALPDQIFHRIDHQAGADGDQQDIRCNSDILGARRWHTQCDNHRSGQVVNNQTWGQFLTLAPQLGLSGRQAARILFGQAGGAKPRVLGPAVVFFCSLKVLRLKVPTDLNANSRRGHKHGVWHVCCRPIGVQSLLMMWCGISVRRWLSMTVARNLIVWSLRLCGLRQPQGQQRGQAKHVDVSMSGHFGLSSW